MKLHWRVSYTKAISDKRPYAQGGNNRLDFLETLSLVTDFGPQPLIRKADLVGTSSHGPLHLAFFHPLARLLRVAMAREAYDLAVLSRFCNLAYSRRAGTTQGR